MVKKLKSKGILVLLLIVAGFASAILGTYASEETKFSISSHDDLERGDEVTFEISGSSVEDFSGLILDISYDPEVLEYKSVSFMGQYAFIQNVLNEVPGVLNLTMAEASTTDYAHIDDGVFATVTFAVSDTASGAYDIGLSLHDEGSYNKMEGINEVLLEGKATGGTYFVNVPLESVDIAKKDYQLVKGTTENILVSYSPADTTEEKKYSFTSNDTNIVTVSEDGTLTAVGNGSTTVDVKAFGKTFTLNVSVVTPITSVEFSKTEKTFTLGVNETLNNPATVKPDDTTDDKKITYSSSNDEVASVSDSGIVTAHKVGSATITAKASNGVLNTYEVNVVVPLKEVSLETSEFELNKGENRTLVVLYDPVDTTEDKKITWESSDPSVVSVSKDGVITALKGGKDVTITGRLTNGMSVVATVDVVVPITDISVDKTSLELLPNQEEEVHVSVTPSDTTDDQTATWVSVNDSIAKVKNGVITAVAPGTTTIKVTVGSITKEISVKVLVPIDQVYPSQSNVTLNKGGSTTLSVLVYPEDAEEDRSVTWKSEDDRIATVDSNGKVTAIAGGSTKIIGTLKNGKTVEVSITVEVPLEKVEIESDNLVMTRGSEKTVKAILTPADTTDTTAVIWESSNSDVATVVDGKIKALGAGVTTITVRVGNFSDSITVEVIVPIESIELNAESLNLNRGEDFDAVSTILPVDTTDKTLVSWTSSNSSVASVDQNGHIVAVGYGDAVITAEVSGHKAEIKVHVEVPITDFVAEETEVNVLRGKSLSLKTTITPFDTSEDTKITWTSSDTKIVTVDEKGVITGIKGGNATITGTLKNGMSVQIKVTVDTILVESLSFKEESVTVLLGQNTSQAVLINPIDATETDEVVWTSSDESVALVDELGNVTGLKAGEAEITVSINKVEASYTVIVKEVPLTSIEITNKPSDLDVGDSFQIEITKNPSDTTDQVTFTYTSSDPNVLLVDENGLVTAVNKGSATITVTASNGLTTTITLTVNEIVNPETGVASVSSYLIATVVSFLGLGFVIYKRVRLN